MDTLMEGVVFAGSIYRHDGFARLECTAGEGRRERELFAAQIGAREVAGCTGHKLVVRRSQEQKAALDASPQHQRVHDAVQERREALAILERAYQRLEIARLLR